MKTVALAALISVPVIGLAIVGPFVVILLIMIAPLVALLALAVFGAAHGTEQGPSRRRPVVEHARHVVAR